MKWFVARKFAALLVTTLITSETIASVDSNGPNGINSASLTLTGAGIGIGQVEAERPGKFGFDDGSHSNFGTIPEAVFIEDNQVTPTANSDAELLDTSIPPIYHATQVAGVIIGKDGEAPGVAQDAKLFAPLEILLPCRSYQFTSRWLGRPSL